MPYTWTELLDDIKVRGMIPTSQSTFTEARLLNLANAEMRTKILPLVDKVREAYYSFDVDTTINASGTYEISKRAVGGKLLNAALLNGNERLDLARYEEEEIQNYTEAPDSYGFYFKGNQFILLPASPSNWSTLRQTILMRPNKLVKQSDAAQITAINTVTKVCTCGTVPSTWTTSSTFDMVQQNPHFDWLGIDLAITAITTGAAGTITFSAALPSRLAVGDWIGLVEETPVIQCPVELHPLLAQETSNTCLKAQNDLTGYRLGKEEAKMMREDILALINPRTQSEGKKLVNRTGILRRGL